MGVEGGQCENERPRKGMRDRVYAAACCVSESLSKGHTR